VKAGSQTYQAASNGTWVSASSPTRTLLLTAGQPRPKSAPPTVDDVVTVANLHQQVASALVAGGVEVPTYLEGDVVERLLPWGNYDSLLRRARTRSERIADLEVLWSQIDAQAEGDDADRHGEQLAATADSELRAETVTEFIELLRTLRARAKGSATTLAERAGIGRSQLYNMLNVDRGVLPTKLEQVKGFAQACGLPAHQVDQLVMLWLNLTKVSQMLTAQRRRSPYTARLTTRLAHIDITTDDGKNAVSRIATLIKDHQHGIASAAVAGILSALDDNVANEVTEYSLTTLAPGIVKVLRKAEVEDPLSLAIEVGFRLAQASAERVNDPTKARLVI
jgi:DNA-binding phage protein